jgi:uncharacterized membrane protein (DUF106 family)
MFEPVIKAIDFIFSPITVFSPAVAILIFSVIVTLLITGLSRLVINRKLVKELKEKMEEVKENLKQAQKEGDKEKTNQFLSEMMKINSLYMKQTLKSFVVSIVIVIIFLPWVKYRYEKVAIPIPFNLPYVGSSLSWIIWYILVAFTVGWVVQKLLGSY